MDRVVGDWSAQSVRGGWLAQVRFAHTITSLSVVLVQTVDQPVSLHLHHNKELESTKTNHQLH
jgi:sugar phosphate permease